jgi:2-keto-myo-inositol isomerase
MFPFKTALNASTLFPFALDVRQQVQVAAEAGYDGIELWEKDILAYLATGGTMADLKKSIASSGIPIVDVMAFYPWADADEEVRRQALAQAGRELPLLAELGCKAFAAPPAGSVASVSLDQMAIYFAQLADLASSIGIEPYLEFWGKARPLSRLSDALSVAMSSGVSGVKVLIDQIHMHIGGTSLSSLAYVKGANIGIVHVNDYLATVPGNEDTEDRVFPGQGIASTHELATVLHQIGYDGCLSLELFIEDYGGESPLEVARRGLTSIRQAYSI